MGTDCTDSSKPVRRRIAPVLALDVGNVVIRLNVEEFARALGAESAAGLVNVVPGLLPLVGEFDCGRISENVFFERLRAMLPWERSRAEIEDAWLLLLGPEIPGIGEFVRNATGKGVRVVLFSDICPVHHRAVMEQISFPEAVSGAVVSYETGALKPDPVMFGAMERRYCGGGVPLLYVDDKPGNVRAARERGWRAYCFGTVDGLVSHFEAALAELEVGVDECRT